MKIPVNKNIDVYKDDFFKGLSMRECLCALLTLVSGTAVFFLSDSLLRLPQEVSLYCALPVSFLCAASGFLKISGCPRLSGCANGSLYPDAFLCVCRGSDREKTSGG